ncbi:unnamed protein product [Mytilus coruscus]|uniref:Uncharacterized protein n=1 Tax=Mytilus coruscus TaxID=42192 RepID=A0A6J8EGZ1_MYTCO|nr:unnamed protein product [Mytilus coruscus]
MSLLVEESNFLIFYYLNLKIASNAVRVYFDSIHPPAGLAGELGNNSTSSTLKRLRFITKQQLNTLYPSPASNVKSEHFDTSLIVCLLRNMPQRECAPATYWDNLPLSTDTSTGADLARVKWYRNKVAHQEDGKLSPTDYSQYWGDLEGAIGRLGGPSMLKEAQSGQHNVLDKSLIGMLNMLRNCEKDVHKHTSMITDLQTTIDNQRTIKEQHESKIQQLNVSIQKGEAEALTLTTEFSEYKGCIEKCTEEIETCKKEIDKMELKIKGIQEKAMDKHNQVGEFTRQLFKLECRYGNKFKEIDEQLATCEKEIDDMKKKHHDEDVTSGGSKQKRLEDDTKALIEEDVREGTFVTITAVTDGLLMLKQNGVLLMTGHAGTGKSRIGRHILRLFCNEDNSYKCIKLNTLKEWENIVSRQNNVIVLLDDIFGETNCIYDRETDTPILDKVHAYVRKGNIQIIITIRDTVRRQCREVFDNHRLFKFDFIDLSSHKYKLSHKEKNNILTKYMKTVRKSDYLEGEGFTDCIGVTILRRAELGSKFFDRPTEAILEEINELRRKGEDDKKCMIQYAVMVHTAVNENRINPDDSSSTFEVVKIIDAIYGQSIKLKKCNISDSVKDLLGSYFVNIPNQRSYRFHHPTLQESVILSFAQIDDENMKKIIPLLSWPFFLKMVNFYDYKEKEGEVVLRIPTNSFELLADRLVTIYEAKIWNNITYAHIFIHKFIHTEIFLQEDCLLLVYFLKALEKEDHNGKLTENMIKSNALFSCYLRLGRKNVFLATLLVIIAKMEKLVEMYNFVLQKFNQVIITCEHYFSIDYMKAALFSSMYDCCSTKDLRSVKSTFGLVEENKIPVLLDQSINLSNIGVTENPFLDYVHDNNDTRCIFLTLCLWEAYQAFNVPVL